MSKLGEDRAGKNALRIYQWLREGKKVTTAGDDTYLNHFEDWNDPNSGTSSSQNTRLTRVLYFWANPQMNRTFGMLADGRTVDIEINLLDMTYKTFMEYLEEPKPESWREVFDASRKILNITWGEVLREAKRFGYSYVAWNELVYSVKDAQQAFPICKEEDIS